MDTSGIRFCCATSGPLWPICLFLVTLLVLEGDSWDIVYYSSSGASQEGHDDLDLGLGDLPSEEEEVINSSDEDDVSSASSKGEPDLLEDKQVCVGTEVFLLLCMLASQDTWK